ncbi:hypothetical protein Tco_0418392 [Tanacetum coccineum]
MRMISITSKQIRSFSSQSQNWIYRNVKESLDGVNLKTNVKTAIGIFFKKFYKFFNKFDKEEKVELQNKTPAGSGVVVPAKMALRDVVTSASMDVGHCWVVPSSPVSTRNRFELSFTLLFGLLLVIVLHYFGIVVETVYAMEPSRPRGLPYVDLNLMPNRYGEPAVLPPRQEFLNTLPEREIYARIRSLQNHDYYNLPPQNNPGEYEGLVRDHFGQARGLAHREAIAELERFGY